MAWKKINILLDTMHIVFLKKLPQMIWTDDL